jgi:hypothetical protein
MRHDPRARRDLVVDAFDDAERLCLRQRVRRERGRDVGGRCPLLQEEDAGEDGRGVRSEPTQVEREVPRVCEPGIGPEALLDRGSAVPGRCQGGGKPGDGGRIGGCGGSRECRRFDGLRRAGCTSR